MVTRRTVDKWIIENDKELDTIIWVMYDTMIGDREHVSALKHGVCIQFQARSKLLFTGTANKMGESSLCMYTDVNGCSCSV